MSEQTHLQIIIAGLITAAGIASGIHAETARMLAVKQTEKITEHFRQQEKASG